MVRFVFLLSIFGICYLYPLCAQRYNFKKYTLEEGLPQSEVIALIQDSKGNIWLGTNGGGLSRFNGKNFENYNRNHGLADNNIRALLQDSKNKLWIGTGHGVSSYNGVSFRNYSEKDSLPEANYLFINEDSHQRIWALGFNQGQNHFHYFENGKIHNYLKENPEFAKNNILYQLFTCKEGTLWVSSRKGLFQLNNKKAIPSPLNTLQEFKNRIITLVKHDNSQDYWIRVLPPDLSWARIYRVVNQEPKELQLPSSVPLQQVGSTHIDSQNRIWISILGTGVALVDGEKIEILDEKRGLFGPFIRKIVEDQEGNIWLGSMGNGLIKYSETKFLALNFVEKTGGNMVRGIYQDSKNYYWFSISGKGVVRFKDHQMKAFTPTDHPGLINIRDFHELPNGNILMAGLNGLLEYNGRSFKEVSTQYGLPNNAFLQDLCPSPQGLWISTLGLGVVRVNKGQIDRFNTENQRLTTNQVAYTYCDEDGSAWFCHYKGISHFDGEKMMHYTKENGPNDDWVIHATKDKLGRYWFATYSGGINIFDGQNWQYLTTEDGIASDNVYSLLRDKEGTIWAGMQNGVDRISYDSSGKITSIRNYNKFDGFSGIENNGGANFVDKKQQLWFGTVKGAMMYNPSKDLINPNPPIIQLTDIKLFFRKINWRSEKYNKCRCGVHPWFPLPNNLRLPYKQHHLTFNFEALSYKAPEKVKYKWKLEGLDEEWSPISSRNEATYANIPPGDFTFKIKASNSDGVWTPKPYEYSFTILTPWWQTWWFRGLALFLIITLVSLLIRLRIRNIELKKRALEEKVRENTKEILLQKTEIEKQNQTLEQQKSEILTQANELEKSYRDLIHLSEIGKVITANLSIEDIIDTVHETLNSLMDATVFGIGIYHPEENNLHFPRIKESGMNMDAIDLSLEETARLPVYCFTHNKNILINDLQEEYRNYVPKLLKVEKSQIPSSLIYLPLRNQNKITGVITVQSFKKAAYQEYHIPLLQNIAAYASIAIENASAYLKIEEQTKRLKNANLKIKKKNQEIKSKNKELLELNHDKNHLIGIIAHDLKNPLTSSLTIAEYIKEELIQNERFEELENVEYMHNALTRMNQMISKILDLRVIESKRINLKMEPTNLAALMENINMNFRQSLNNKKLNMNLDCQEVYAKADPNYMTQVYENLISNAIKFSPHDKNIWVKIWEDGENVCTLVKDEGPGFTHEDKKLLFGKFQQLSAKPTGGEKSTGLGLSIVKKYVEAMSGRVWCESQPGDGANFYIELQKA